MRFDKETRAKIHEAAPNPTTIKWPAGASEPQKGRVYWMQSLEDAQRERERLQYSPPSHKDVLAAMYLHFYGKLPDGYKPPRRKGPRRKPDEIILVLDVEILEKGWNAKVVLYEDPDPVRHTGLKTKIKGGAHPIDKEWGTVATELEPEKIVVAPSRSEREDEEDAFRVEHAASLDQDEIARAERRMKDQRRKGKSGKLAQQALERARKRATA